MKVRRKNIVWGFFAIAVTVLLSLTHSMAKESQLSKVDIQLVFEHGQPLLTKSRIKEDLEFAHLLRDGQFGEKGSIAAIESFVKEQPHVKSCEVFTDLNGNLVIRVQPRIPIARVFFSNGMNAYIDQEGFRLPPQSGMGARVPVFSGSIADTLFPTTALADSIHTDSLISNSLAGEITELAKYVCLSEEWSSQITQIVVLPNGQFELIPRIGQHMIQFGRTDRMEEKFENLRTFYREGLPYVGWNLYHTIDLRYEGQVVGRKINEGL